MMSHRLIRVAARGSASRLAYGCVLGALATCVCAATPTVAPVTNYRIDPLETRASFEVRFLGLVPIRGEFRNTTGSLNYDRESRQGRIDVFIDATTVETSTAGALASARGPGFFNVEKFPSIDFRSSRFVFEESKLKSVEGMLNMVGLSQPVTLAVTDSHCEASTTREAAHCHADGEMVIRRSDFGMNGWSHSLSDHVRIRVAIVAREAAPAATATP